MNSPAPRRTLTLLLLAAAFLSPLWPLPPAARVSAMSLAGRQDRRQFEAAVKDAFFREDYATLEATRENLVTQKDRFPEGLWTLTVFCLAFTLDQQPLHVTRDLEARLTRWQTQFPQSVAVRVARAQALRSEKWDRVETGANPGAPKTSKTDRLARARAELEAVPEERRGPDWFAERLRVAWFQKVPRAEFEELFARAVALEPTYQPLYFAKADFLRTEVRRGAWAEFAREAGERNLSGEGLGLYARVVWSQSELYADGAIFRQPGVEWPRMRDGFRDLDRIWPDADWNLNNFCRFACLAGDRGTARELFGRIGDRWTSNWLSQAAFEGWREWAAADVDPGASTPSVRLAPPGEAPQPRGWSVAFAADGRSVFGGYSFGRVVRWDAATGAERWRGTLGAGNVYGLAPSPDGRTLAAGTAMARTKGFVGTLGLWDLPADGGNPAEARPDRRLGDGQHRGGPFTLCWAADGRTLAAFGGSYLDGFGETWVWAMPEGREVRHVTNWPLVLVAATFLDPAGKRLVFGSGQSFHVVETATGAKVFTPDGKMHAAAVRALARSPDGRTLACATADRYEDRDRPGEVAFWDTATWTRRPGPHVTGAGGVNALAWSPDGRWLAGGGYDGFLRVWDAATGKTVRVWPPGTGDGGTISAVAWAPDNRRVAVMRMQGAGAVHTFEPPPAE